MSKIYNGLNFSHVLKFHNRYLYIILTNAGNEILRQFYRVAYWQNSLITFMFNIHVLFLINIQEKEKQEKKRKISSKIL